NHSVDRLSSRVLEERGEFVNLASSKRPHESGDVSTQSPASNNYPKNLTLGLDHSVFRDIICRRDDHWDASLPSVPLSVFVPGHSFTSEIRNPSTAATSNRLPPTSTRSPTRGRRPISPRTNPPIVS